MLVQSHSQVQRKLTRYLFNGNFPCSLGTLFHLLFSTPFCHQISFNKNSNRVSSLVFAFCGGLDATLFGDRTASHAYRSAPRKCLSSVNHYQATGCLSWLPPCKTDTWVWEGTRDNSGRPWAETCIFGHRQCGLRVLYPVATKRNRVKAALLLQSLGGWDLCRNPQRATLLT